jgi:hypothetical protein
LVGVDPPNETNDKAATDQEEEEGGGFWDYVLGKLEGFKEWVDGFADSGRDPA